MKLTRLDLPAFGPFTESHFDFGAERARLHVVYGPNEAGKSTALRAIGALLYGFPHHTQDAHRHASNALRVGGRLVPREGEPLEVVRRKGRKDTLLAPDGAPIDESRLTAVLGGASEASFRAMFGLDHESLRRGAEALLAGGGDVGESLFDAALGGRGVHALLAALRAEADASFRPRAKRARVPEALEAYREAQRLTRDAEIAAESYEGQVAELERAEEAQRARVGSLRVLEARRERFRRLARVHRHVIALDHATEALEALGPVARVPEGTRERRHEIEQRLRDARRDAELRRSQRDRREEELAALPAIESLADLPETVAADLRDRLGSHRGAEAKRPALVAELDRRRAEIAGKLRLLERESDGLDEVLDALRPVLANRGRLKRLGRRGAELLAEVGRLEPQALETRETLGRLEGRRAEREPPPDPERLTALLVRVRSEGGPRSPHRAPAEARLSELERQVAASLRSLGRPDADPEALVTASAPTLAEVEGYRRRSEDRRAKRERHEHALREVDAQLAEVAAELDAIGATGEVPTEEALHAARARRDESLDRLRFVLDARGGTHEAGAALDGLAAGVAKADTLADRLRRETARIEKAAALSATQRKLEVQREREHAALAALDVAERGDDETWRRAWAATGLEPGAPEAMAAWIEGREALARALGERADLVARRAQLVEREVEVEASLRGTLEEMCRSPDPGLDVEPLFAWAERVEAAAVEEGRTWAALERDTEDARAALERVERKVDACRTALEAWRAEWGPAIEPLGLDAAADPEDALDRLDAAAELVSLHDALGEREATLRAYDDEAEALAADVARLAREHGVELRGTRLEEQADSLVALAAAAKARREARDALEQSVAEARVELTQREDEVVLAERELAALFESVGVGDREALVEAEDRAERARQLLAQRGESHAAIVQEAEGDDLDALAAEARAGRVERFRAEADDLESEIAAMRDEKQAEDQRIGQLRSGLDHLRGRAGAAEAAERAASAAARAAREIDRYVELHVAVRALSSEIDRYREENQGPVIERASALFPRLTVGRYAKLAVGFDGADEPRLEAVREDGVQVAVDALSDGTRDQLYLALRLATLERWAERREPLPFVLDDAFVHFDRERVQAAVEVLGELAPDLQTILFTHHDFVVDCARRVVPADRLVVHEIAPAPFPAAASPLR